MTGGHISNLNDVALALSSLSLVFQLVGLGALIKVSIRARRHIKSKSFTIVDGGDALGQTTAETLSDAVQFLLEEHSKILMPLVTIGLGSALQLLTLFLVN